MLMEMFDSTSRNLDPPKEELQKKDTWRRYLLAQRHGKTTGSVDLQRCVH